MYIKFLSKNIACSIMYVMAIIIEYILCDVIAHSSSFMCIYVHGMSWLESNVFTLLDLHNK